MIRQAIEALKRRAAMVAALHAIFPALDRYGIPERSDPAYLKQEVAALRQELTETRRLTGETQARFRSAEEVARSFIKDGPLETWKALQAERDSLCARVAELETRLRGEAAERLRLLHEIEELSGRPIHS